MRYYVETKSNLSTNLKGPIDPRNGWPTIHQSLIVEAESLEEAQEFFERKFPGNVLAIIPDDI